jgi:glycosyltransferase involved in cell wall biosynthesis
MRVDPNDGENSVLLSVIVPVYNVQKYLNVFFDCLQRQKVEATEYIFVDDGSSDRSGSIIDEFEKNKGYRIFHRDNAGVAAARNIGVKEARGKYVCFLDPDDIISDNYLDNMLHAAMQNSADVVISNWAKVRGKSVTPRLIFSAKAPQIITKEYVFEQILTDDYILGSLWAKLFSKDLFIDNRFPDQRTCSDFIPCIKALSRAKTIVYEPESYYYYTSARDTSLQNTQSPKDVRDSVFIHHELSAFVHKEFPELSNLANLDVAFAQVQACVHICRSNKIKDKKALFNFYKKDLSHHLGLMCQSRVRFSDKILFLLAVLGFWPMSVALYIRSVIHRARR